MKKTAIAGIVVVTLVIGVIGVCSVRQRRATPPRCVSDGARRTDAISSKSRLDISASQEPLTPCPGEPPLEQYQTTEDAQLEKLFSCESHETSEFIDAVNGFLHGSQLTRAKALDLFNRARASGDKERMIRILMLIRLGAPAETDHQIGISIAEDQTLPVIVRSFAVKVALRRIARNAAELDQCVRRNATLEEGMWSDMDPMTPEVRTFVRTLLSAQDTPGEILSAAATGLSGFMEDQADIAWTDSYLATLVNNDDRLCTIITGLADIPADERARMLDREPELVTCLTLVLGSAPSQGLAFLRDESLAIAVSEQRREVLLDHLSRTLDYALQSSPLEQGHAFAKSKGATGDPHAAQAAREQDNDLLCRDADRLLRTYLLYLRFSKDDHVQLDPLYRAVRSPAVDVQSGLALELGAFRQPWAVDVLRTMHKNVGASSPVEPVIKGAAMRLTANGVPGAAQFLSEIR